MAQGREIQTAARPRLCFLGRRGQCLKLPTRSYFNTIDLFKIRIPPFTAILVFIQGIETRVREWKVSLFLIMQKVRERTDKLMSQMTPEKLP